MKEVFTARPRKDILIGGVMFRSKIKYIVSVEIRDTIYIKGKAPIAMPDYGRHREAVCHMWDKDIILSSDDFLFE